MKIIIMRHGQAAYSGLDRVLTAHGGQEAERTAMTLAARLKVSRILCSPKTRAQETARAAASKFLGWQGTVELCQDLTPAGNAAAAVEYACAQCGPEDNILLVSHIPLVEELCQYLCPQQPVPFFVTAGAFIAAKTGDLWRPEAFISPQGENLFDL